MENLMSLREFAKYARVSPQRLLTLVNEGKIKRVNGFIPASEYEYFIREELLKGISRQNRSVLYVGVNIPDDIFVNTASKIKEVHSVTDATYTTSINNLIVNIYTKSLTNYTDGSESAKQREILQLKDMYMTAIIKEFIKRLDDAVIRLIAKSVTTKVISVYPLISIYEMLLFDKLYTNTGVSEKELREVLNTVIDFQEGMVDDDKSNKRKKKNSLNQILSNSFYSIVSALNMREPSGNLVITRNDLTPEFIKAIHNLSDQTLINEDHPLYSYMNSNMLFGSSSSRKEDGADAEKIKQQVLDKKHNFNKSTAIGNYTSKGIYSVINITDNTPLEELQKIITDVQNGYYKYVIVLSDEENAKNCMRESFYMAIRGMALTNKIQLEFTDRIDVSKYFKKKKVEVPPVK